jgi:hypothetical protein
MQPFGAAPRADAPPHGGGGARLGGGGSRAELEGWGGLPGVIEQMVGGVGDVFLMHPWLVHSGTLNLCVCACVRWLAWRRSS